MAFDAHANFAISTVATAPSPATSGTTLVVQPGHGARFPAAPFNITVCAEGELPDPGNAEILRVTAKVGDTLTVSRQAEPGATAARNIGVGDVVFAGITALTLTELETQLANRIDIQLFTSSGTWTKPTGARLVHVLLIGGGGGGGAGRRGANGTVRGGGAGGNSGMIIEKTMRGQDVGATVAVTVGAGGTGAAATGSDSTNGASGTSGGITSFGTFFQALGGAGGGGGSSGAGGVPGTLINAVAQQAGVAGGVGAGSLAPSTTYNLEGAGAGGGGGGVSSANTDSAGGPGGAGGILYPGSALGGAGGGAQSDPKTPINGSDGTSTFILGSRGKGGGGGGSSTSVAAGSGGNGGIYGGGGGGGGASTNGFASGEGGDGGIGIALVFSHF